MLRRVGWTASPTLCWTSSPPSSWSPARLARAAARPCTRTQVSIIDYGYCLINQYHHLLMLSLSSSASGGGGPHALRPGPAAAGLLHPVLRDPSGLCCRPSTKQSRSHWRLSTSPCWTRWRWSSSCLSAPQSGSTTASPQARTPCCGRRPPS